MGEVVTIGQETVTQFIARNGGVANTSNIAQRFCWSVTEAKRRLDALAASGLVEKVPAHAWSLGQICSWRLPA